MMSHKIKNFFLSIFILVFTILFFTNGRIVIASNIPTAVDNLSESTNQLIEARDSSSDGILPENEDLARRRKVISDVLALSLKEIESAREKINTTELEKESDLKKIKDIILEWLNLQEKWFRSTEERLSNEKLNLDEIRNLAREIKTYREENYDKEMANVLNFILAIETQRLTNIALDRWNRISSDLRRIERAGLIQRNLFATEMRDAQKMIDGAYALVERALSVSKEIYLPSKEDIKIISDEKEKVAVKKPPSVRDLCEAAIVNLRSSYGEFAKISTSVRRLLRLP